jgi:SOS-response transcriptional repressor LexA
MDTRRKIAHMQQRQPSRTRQEVYDFIKRYKREHAGNSPTLRNIGEALYLSLSSVNYHVRQLQKEGRIQRTPHVARGIVVLHDDDELSPDE